VTYTGAAFALLDGNWAVSSYVGANRYGVNLPVAGFGWLFGRNEFAAAAYSMLCSVAEVGLVAYFGARMFTARAGFLAGLVLATLPIHVHFAGRMMADAPLALAVTASFLFFWDGESRNRRLSFFVAGLAAAWAFWVKPATIFYAALFLTYPLLFRTFNLRWGWMAVGFLVVMVANGLFFQVLTGNFWFVLQNMAERSASGYLGTELAAGSQRNEPLYYFGYLYVKIFHTWALGFLALAASVAWLYKRRSHPSGSAAMPFVLWWGGGMLLILSLLVVSFSPLTLIPKQTNYMLMFVAPLALMAGYLMAQVRDRWQAVSVAAVVVPAIVLSLLLQANIAVFTANSKATVQFAHENSGATVYASTNGYRLGQFHALVLPDALPVRIRALEEWNKTIAGASGLPGVRYAIVDPQTQWWGSREPFRELKDRPSCWVMHSTLVPVVQGVGPRLVQALADLASAVPWGSVLHARLSQLAAPRPAYVFKIPDTGC